MQYKIMKHIVNKRKTIGYNLISADGRIITLSKDKTM